MLKSIKLFFTLFGTVLFGLFLFSDVLWAQEDYQPTTLNGPVELYIPYSSDANNGNGWRMGRTGRIYKSYYEARNLDRPGADLLCMDRLVNGDLTTLSIDHNNYYCDYPNVAATEYHDSTSARGFNRSSIDFFGMDGEVTSASKGMVIWLDDTADPNEVCSDEGTIQVLTGDYVVEYLHTRDNYVNIGDIIEIGSRLARTGNCGDASLGTHLHLTAFVPQESAGDIRNHVQNNGGTSRARRAVSHHDVEIRFLDAYAKMVDEFGIPIPSKRMLGGGNGSVVGQMWYKANPHPKTDASAPNRTQLMVQLQYGMRVRVITPQARLYNHLEDPASIGAFPLFGWLTINDPNQIPYITGYVSNIGEIYRAPENWSGTYPFVADGITYWFYRSTNGVTGWINQNDLSGCLSDAWCDVAPTDRLYRFAVAAQARAVGENGFGGCDNEAPYRWLCVNDRLKRDEAAKVVYEVAMGGGTPVNCQTENIPNGSLPDVDRNSSLCSYIREVYNANVMTGKTGGNFEPAGNITKAEWATTVVRALRHRGFQCNTNIDGFAAEITDVHSNNPHYQNVVCLWNAMRDYLGELQQQFGTSVNLGNNRQLNPEDLITRLESTKYLAVALAVMHLAEHEAEETSGGNEAEGTGRCWNFWVAQWGNCGGVQSADASNVSVEYPMATPAGDVDWIRFNVQEELFLSILAEKNQLNAWIRIQIYDSGGTLLGTAEGNNFGTNASVTLAPGTYFVKMTNMLSYVQYGANYSLRIYTQSGQYVNVALNKTAYASNRGERAVNAIDSNLGNAWEAGRFAPAWITVDLGSHSMIHKFRLLTDQSPAGNTVHELQVNQEQYCSEQYYYTVYTFSGNTATNQWLEHVPLAPISVKCFRVNTISSPSWVAWRELEAYAYQTPNSPEPLPAPIAPDPATATVEQLFDASSIEDVQAYVDTSIISYTLKIFNRGEAGLVVPIYDNECRSWYASVYLYIKSGESVLWQNNQSAVVRDCYWGVGEYFEVYGYGQPTLQPGVYDFVVSLDIQGRTSKVISKKVVVFDPNVQPEQPNVRNTWEAIYDALTIKSLSFSHGVSDTVTINFSLQNTTGDILVGQDGEAYFGFLIIWLRNEQTREVYDLYGEQINFVQIQPYEEIIRQINVATNGKNGMHMLQFWFQRRDSQTDDLREQLICLNCQHVFLPLVTR